MNTRIMNFSQTSWTDNVVLKSFQIDDRERHSRPSNLVIYDLKMGTHIIITWARNRETLYIIGQD